MLKTSLRSTAAALLLGLAACTADEDATEIGDADVPLDAPERIEDAPLADEVGPENLEPNVVAEDTLVAVPIDTTNTQP